MKFHFDIDKSIAATAYLIELAGGKHNILHLVKMLYHANRSCFVKYGRTITGDRPVSMDMGPVVSQTYNLLKGSDAAKPVHLMKWQNFISPRDGHVVSAIAKPDMEYLSRRELDALDEAFSVVSSVKGLLADWSHSYFPEWSDPKGGSEDIDPKDILKVERKSAAEIEEIEDEINSLNWLKSLTKQ
jgi:hypothetical protein